ncbi:aldolase/citrate lyase family protein [Aneurinibacillus sp. Ricciae_BoGa-3]|uniref:HpcH/HpaI aldolase family protein n=1 Tax=Aneurinibacillus sp. Ricciae_BoGa-3 TaxID=3022697 RepID=UPI002340F4FF|nr:aldolase/citrate lyase family protein [Aneurinibacillus sp. Ricciae_BoGa-3]WCK54574.1 aldolase/citrate lyase family protein [Aneurinibacillus sp. Ricciae_BoGa-3]
MLKDKIINNVDAVGIWQRIPSSMVAEIISLTAIDFVSIDMEHGAIDIADLRTIVPIYTSQGIPTVLRIASQHAAFISKVLDLGIDGVMVPQIQTAEEARAIVEYSKYAPLGKRGLGGSCAADGYGELAIDEFIENENRRVTTIIQIETEQAIQNIDEIIEVQGIDLFYIGPFDLSQALGLPGKLDHPVVVRTIKELIYKVKEKGKPVGMHAPHPDFINRWKEHGVHYFTYGMDSSFLKQGIEQAYKALIEIPKARRIANKELMSHKSKPF